jgi:hypothetical protein
MSALSAAEPPAPVFGTPGDPEADDAEEPVFDAVLASYVCALATPARSMSASAVAPIAFLVYILMR